MTAMVFRACTVFSESDLEESPPYLRLIYLGNIRDHRDSEFIVAVSVHYFDGEPKVSGTVWNPGIFLHGPSLAPIKSEEFDFGYSMLDDASTAGPTLKIYAGQPDLADSSHFTIDYELKGQRHTLDCYLDPQDGLTIRKRSAATTQQLPLSMDQSR